MGGATDRETRRGVRVAEGARLESVYWGNSVAGSNPALSATHLPAFGARVKGSSPCPNPSKRD